MKIIKIIIKIVLNKKQNHASLGSAAPGPRGRRSVRGRRPRPAGGAKGVASR